MGRRRHRGAGHRCALTDLARAGHLRGTVIGITCPPARPPPRTSCATWRRRTAPGYAATRNNELGVPKTLLSADPDTRFVVVEMGM